MSHGAFKVGFQLYRFLFIDTNICLCIEIAVNLLHFVLHIQKGSNFLVAKPLQDYS